MTDTSKKIQLSIPNNTNSLEITRQSPLDPFGLRFNAFVSTDTIKLTDYANLKWELNGNYKIESNGDSDAVLGV